MKNNKGFTLIELLVVVVILVSISMVAVPNITKSISERKEKEKEKNKELLKEYADLYISKNSDISSCFFEGGYIELDKIAQSKDIEGSGYGYYTKDGMKEDPSGIPCLENAHID